MAQKRTYKCKDTYWVLGVRNSKSGSIRVGIASTRWYHLLTTDPPRVGVLPTSGQALWCLDEKAAQVPRLKLGLCIQWEIATFMYDHTNRLTAVLSMDVFSPEKPRAKGGIDPRASKYVGMEQLGR